MRIARENWRGIFLIPLLLVEAILVSCSIGLRMPWNREGIPVTGGTLGYDVEKPNPIDPRSIVFVFGDEKHTGSDDKDDGSDVKLDDNNDKLDANELAVRFTTRSISPHV